MIMMSPDYLKNVVKETRERRGETQEDFAKNFIVDGKPIGRNSIWQWEMGRNFPGDALLPKLSELSGISVEELRFAKRAIGLIQDGIDLRSFTRYLAEVAA